MQCASTLVLGQILTTKFDMEAEDDVCVASRLTVASITYKRGDFLAVGVHDEHDSSTLTYDVTVCSVSVFI